MVTRLPLELTDHMIGFLDRKTLKACSLVCKNWLPSSRYHLFGHLCLKHSTLRSFLELLDSPLSTIANYIHTFEINDPLLDVIAPYLDRFNIRSLMLRGCGSDISWEHEENVLKWFSGIKTLQPVLMFSHPDHYFGLISSFHSLETLTIYLEGFNFGSDDLRHIRSFAFPPHLRELKIHFSYWNRPILSWLVSIAHFPAIHTVRLYAFVHKYEELREVENLMRSLGPSVHSFDFWFSLTMRAFIQLFIDESISKPTHIQPKAIAP